MQKYLARNLNKADYSTQLNVHAMCSIHCTLAPSQVPGVLCARHDCVTAVSWQVHATNYSSLLALPALVDTGIHMVSYSSFTNFTLAL